MADISDGIQFRRDGIDPSQWPKLSCSAANQLALEFSSLTLDGNREVAFQGNGLLKITGDLRILTGNPATEKLTMLVNGNMGIGESNPMAKLSVNGSLKLQQGVAVNEFSNDPNLTDNTDLSVPTEKAVKSYVDAKITPLNTALLSKAAIAGSSSQNFQTQNLSVNGNLTTTGKLGIGVAAPVNALDVLGIVKATAFQGDGSGLTNLPVSNNIGIAVTPGLTNGASIPIPSGFTQNECVFFAYPKSIVNKDIRTFHCMVSNGVLQFNYSNEAGQAIPNPPSDGQFRVFPAYATGVAIAKKGGW